MKGNSHYALKSIYIKGGKNGHIGGLLGNAWELDAEDVENEMGRLLAVGEQVEKAYKLVRDLIILLTSVYY